MTDEQSLQRVLHELAVIKKAVVDVIKEGKVTGFDKTFMSLEECADFTGLKKSTLYQLTSQKRIPHYKPNGNRVFFKTAEVEKWLLSNRVATAEELEDSAAKYLVNRTKAKRIN